MTPASDAAVALLPCPHCGGVAVAHDKHGRDCSETWVGCTKCQARTASVSWMGNNFIAVSSLTAAWNRRTPALDAAARTGVDPLPNWCRTCGRHFSDPMAVFCPDPIHHRAAIAAATDGGEG